MAALSSLSPLNRPGLHSLRERGSL